MRRKRLLCEQVLTVQAVSFTMKPSIRIRIPHELNVRSHPWATHLDGTPGTPSMPFLSKSPTSPRSPLLWPLPHFSEIHGPGRANGPLPTIPLASGTMSTQWHTRKRTIAARSEQAMAHHGHAQWNTVQIWRTFAGICSKLFKRHKLRESDYECIEEPTHWSEL